MPESRIPPQMRKVVAKRANYCCEYCWSQEKFSPDSFEVEHPIPKSRGGSNTLQSLAWSCGGCNRHKGTKLEGRDPVTGELIPLYNPRTQNWSDHFQWSDNFAVVIGITATGRATVNELKLNREGVVNLRRVLYEMGEHPPIELMESLE